MNVLQKGTTLKDKDPRFKGKIGWIPFAFHLVPLIGLAKVAAVMRKGEVSGRGDNWRSIPVEEHINHAIGHLLSFLDSPTEYHHLSNAGCRILMALDLDDNEPEVECSPGDDVIPKTYPAE